MAILRFENNKPYALALRYKAKEVSGQFGKQFQYFFLGGDIAYLPPIAHAEIESLHLDLGDTFTLTKTQVEGQAIQWTAERAQRKNTESHSEAHARLYPKPMAQAQEIAPAKPTLTTAQSQQLVRQLIATIQAVKAAEEFSISIDRPVKFDAADIRAIAISGFIEYTRRQAA